MRIFKYLLVLTLFLTIQSCVGTKVQDVKSPCVSGEDGPCGNKKPVNSWLEKHSA